MAVFRMSVLAICITFSMAAGATEAGSSAHRTRSISGRVDRYVQPLVEMRDFSGVVLVARAGHVLVRRAYGLASQELRKECRSGGRRIIRSEEHTSELQAPDHLLCRLLLEKTQHSLTLMRSADLITS